MKSFLFPAVILAALISCNNNQPDKDLSIVPPPKAVAVDTTQAPGTANGLSTGLQPALTQPQGTPVSTAPQQAAGPSKVSTASGLNPAHGQPGHRCDISVGAPLNSPPKPTSGTAPISTVMGTPQKTPTAAPVAIPNNSTAKLNPAHGQPGHRCEIAVGAPLN